VYIMPMACVVCTVFSAMRNLVSFVNWDLASLAYDAFCSTWYFNFLQCTDGDVKMKPFEERSVCYTI